MSQRSEFNLVKLLQPVSPSTFFSEYWEEKPLHVSRRCRGYYDSLLTLNSVDPLVTVFPPNTVLVVNSDAPVEAKDVTRGDTSAADAALDVVKACQLFAAGATIIVRDAHERVATLTSLCRTLESEVGAPFKTNLYMTPPLGKGFDTHYDTHDTILLQVAGSKEWTIFESPVRLPLIGQHFEKHVHQIGRPLMSLVLEAGDLLYIPRGYFHQGRSRDDISLHATVSVWPYRWSDVMLEVVAQLCLADPEFRRSVPVGLGRPDFDVAAARRTFAELLSRLAQRAKLDPVLERFADEFVVGRRAYVPGQIEQLAQAQRLALDDEVGARPSAIYRLREEGETLSIRSHGREIKLPAEAGEAIRFALGNARYRARDLPGDFGDDDKLAIVKRLIEEGLVWKLSGG